jgi:ribosome maturation factor RimP
MNIVNQVHTWLQEIDEISFFPVGVEWKDSTRKLNIFMDGVDGITIEQCRKINKLISAKLDEIDFGDGKYTLEVSSPGADLPLVDKRQYSKHIGREMQVKLAAQTLLTGKLLAVSNDGINLQLHDKKKRYTDQSPTKHVEWSDIAEAKIIISFK